VQSDEPLVRDIEKVLGAPIQRLRLPGLTTATFRQSANPSCAIKHSLLALSGTQRPAPDCWPTDPGGKQAPGGRQTRLGRVELRARGVPLAWLFHSAFARPQQGFDSVQQMCYDMSVGRRIKLVRA